MIDATGAWLRRHPLVVDGALALAVFVYTLPLVRAAVPIGVPVVVVLGVVAAECAAFLWCRERPVVGFAVIVATFAVQVALGIGVLPTVVVMFLALYRVAATVERWLSVLAAGVIALAVGLAAVRWDDPEFATPELGSVLLVIASVWVWGSVVGLRRAYVGALEARAIQLEQDQENQRRIIVATERARIAREIHDIVSHGLSVVVVLAGGAAANVRSDPEGAAEAMGNVEDVARQGLSEMRRMLNVLRDDEPGSRTPAPGLGQLARLVEEARSAGTPIELSTAGTERGLPAGVDLVVYRVVQEALTNARKHGGPELSRVEVRMTAHDDRVEVSVADDGRGHTGDPPNGVDAGGHGLVGMRERVTAYGGAVRAGPRPGGGFEVSATVPIDGGTG